MDLHIGSNIRKIRMLKNVPQKYLADELKMSVSGYCKLEKKDDISIEYITRIADVLEVSYQSIIEFDEEKIFQGFGGEENTMAS